MTEASPLFLPTLTIDHHDERRRWQRNGIDVDDIIAAAGSYPAPSRSQQQSSLPLTTQSMQQQAISTSILPVIDEVGDSGDDSISSHSAGSIRGHWNPLLLDDSRSHCVVWPPRGYAAWPPPSDSEDDDEGSMFGQYLPTTIYGSLPLSNQLHRDGENNITDTPPLIRPLPAISSGVRILANRQEVSGSQQQQQQQPRNILRSLLIVRLAFSLLAMIVWLSVLSQAPDDSYTDTTVSDFAYSADEPWGGFEQRSTNNSDDDDDDDDDDDGKPKHYASSSLLSTLPYYRRNYDEYERGGEGGFIEYARNSNDDGNNGTILAEIDNDLEGIEEGSSNSHQEYGIDPIIQTDVSTSLPSDITFADLAGMMLPSYFQRTVRLCISTIKPAIINHTTIEDNVTVTTLTKTTSVSPGDVFKLRKTMLKTRDMLDAFSPVFSTQSSLDDYDRKKYGELILKFKPWKNVKLEGERMLEESNYLTGDTNVIINAEQQNGRTSRRLPTQHGGKYIFKDLWYTLRRFLDRGYTLIGDFQDLDHAKIMVSPAQLAQYQHQVWYWTDEFMTFVTKNRHHISLYLSLPCKLRKKKQLHNCRYVHSHSSHLFWGAVHSERDLPNGNKDKATYVLGRLGYMQLGRAKAYLVDVLAREHVISTNDYLSTNETTSATSSGDGAQDKIDFNDEDKDQENEVHEIYHNLRKELRSLLDELDLFGDLLLPQTSIVPEVFSNKFTVSEDQTDSMSSSATPSPPTSSIPSTPSVRNQTDEAVELLRSVRNMLGDLNDSFVAYAKYLEWNEYLDKRLELQNDVETQWGTFRAWANEVDLIAKLNFLMGEIEPPLQFHSAGGGIQAYSSLDSFLIEQKESPSNHFVLGNDAGDADSIISAITLAYIESMKRGKSITPVVSISKDVFVHERPDIVRAFELAGIQSASEKLIFIEDLDDIVIGNSADITLVDHNTLNSSLRLSIRKKLIVREILDHHIDEGKYLKTCADDHRNIAFRDGQPLVASTSTLVAEKLQLLFDSPYPPSIGILLLGVILLDSVNLDVAIGKVTDRDRVSVSDLLVNTDWSNVIVPVTYRKSDGVIAVDTTELFNELQMAKYDPQFWSDISATRALGYDVKYFHQIGISTILMPATLFMEKYGFVESTLAFIGTGHISLLVIMFAFYDEDSTFRRQLAFISTDQHIDVRLLVESLLSSDSYKLVDLQLNEVAIPAQFDDSFQIILFDQKNVSPSRKEIGPMLEDFFNSRLED